MNSSQPHACPLPQAQDANRLFDFMMVKMVELMHVQPSANSNVHDVAVFVIFSTGAEQDTLIHLATLAPLS